MATSTLLPRTGRERGGATALPLPSAAGGWRLLLGDAARKTLSVVSGGGAGGGEGGGVVRVEDGPTHLASHPSGGVAYALCAGSGLLLVADVGRDGGGRGALTLVQRVELVNGADADGTDGSSSAAGALACSSDGSFVYVACGGRISALRTSEGGRRLELAQREAPPASGPSAPPVGLALAGGSEELLLSAEQGADLVRIYRRDVASGRLDLAGEVGCPAPCCVLPLAWPPPA